LYGLLALDHYSKTLKGNKAPSVKISLGDQEIVNATLKGKDKIKLASAKLPQNGELTIRSQGKVHYNIELRYRQREETLKEESHGLVLKREYRDENGQPKRTFKVGDVVLVRLTMPLSDSVSHLMVSDRLPAGFEALNTRFKTVGVAGVQQSRQYWGGHREMRDDRVDFSSQYNWRSTYTREYMMRAIAEGRFAVPPSHAELMYEPEKNAQTALTHIEVKAK